MHTVRFLETYGTTDWYVVVDPDGNAGTVPCTLSVATRVADNFNNACGRKSCTCWGGGVCTSGQV